MPTIEMSYDSTLAQALSINPWSESFQKAQMKRRTATKKRTSQTQFLAHWFVTKILEREWTPADYKSMHMKHSKDVLQEYELGDVCGCLEATKDGLFGEIEPTYITIIRKLEPSLMRQWQEYKKTSPPIYLESSVAEWEERVSRVYGEVPDLESA